MEELPVSDHLSPEAIDRFAARAMDGEERTAARRHLLDCPECRARLRASPAYPEAGRREAAVIAALEERPGCPAPRLRTAYASGASSVLAPEQRAEVATHLRRCRACARDVRALEAVRGEVAGRPTPPASLSSLLARWLRRR